MTQTVELDVPTPAPRSLVRTAVPALVLASGACALLLWGRSYPGFPVSTATLALLATAAALVLPVTVRPRGWRPAVLMVAVTVVLGAGIAASAVADGAPLRARWSGSVATFETEVGRLGPPTAFDPTDDSWSWRNSPGPCPARLGSFRVSECTIIDGGYLFVQAPDAVTDVSGIAYLPGGITSGTSGLGPAGLTLLGGPWWSWTCHC